MAGNRASVLVIDGKGVSYLGCSDGTGEYLGVSNEGAEYLGSRDGRQSEF